MNKMWRTAEGHRFSSLEMQRIQRRFRHHVRTPSNPRGRIHREPCCRHPTRPAVEGHHVDYSRPFLVAWVCLSCHRRVEAGTLRLGKKDLWDYSSLIIQRPGGQKR